jgi:cytochrome P450
MGSAAAALPQLPTNPVRRIAGELLLERRAVGRLPAGDVVPSVRRTRAMIRDPLHLLLDAYARHGPVFSLRVLHARNVFVLGPEANHQVLVSEADAFRWRDGAFSELIPLLGDGLLTTDGERHRRDRRIMLPAFHRERIAAAAGIMREEAERALTPWRDGMRVEVYHWARELALRVALRALFGIDPDAARRRPGDDPARDFERALAFYGYDYWLQVLRGPRTPWAAMQAARRRLDGLIAGEIARRRATGARGEDVLSLLLDARDDQTGELLDDAAVRDETMTLLFAGHDTTTATVSFLLYELAGHPGVDARLAADPALLDQVLDETLRLYPPAWIGPRRAARDVEIAGTRIGAGLPVNYSSWVSHRLPDVWDEPDAFRPERFAPAARAKLPKGAYVPFGGGSRICIGMRFGQLEIKVIAAALLERFRVERVPGHRLEVRHTPTLGPHGGLPLIVRQRSVTDSTTTKPSRA